MSTFDAERDTECQYICKYVDIFANMSTYLQICRYICEYVDTFIDCTRSLWTCVSTQYLRKCRQIYRLHTLCVDVCVCRHYVSTHCTHSHDSVYSVTHCVTHSHTVQCVTHSHVRTVCECVQCVRYVQCVRVYSVYGGYSV